MTRLRDERGLYTDAWGWGIYRTAMIQAGERLVKRGQLRRASDFVDARKDEIAPMLLGQGGPSSTELADRADFRSAHTLAEAPPFLGAPVPPPPLDAMPPELRRVERAMVSYLGCIFDDAKEEPQTAAVRGVPVSPGKYAGRARVIFSAESIGEIQKGDILVTPSTTAAFNMALPLLGAIVTDRGGTLSHAAIVAREFGIPAIVGCREATRKIACGAQIEVDGERGEVRFV
jgi:pyruvate,water dikinase